jgi:hypothetical protein
VAARVRWHCRGAMCKGCSLPVCFAVPPVAAQYDMHVHVTRGLRLGPRLPADPHRRCPAASPRLQVIEMVLATDMKQHFSLLSHFSTVHRLASYKLPAVTPAGGDNQARWGATEHTLPPHPQNDSV